MAGRTALFQPAIGRAVHHHQFAEAGAPGPPHMHRFHLPGSRPPQSRDTHPVPQRFPAHHPPAACQMLGGQGGAKARIASLTQLAHGTLSQAWGSCDSTAARAAGVRSRRRLRLAGGFANAAPDGRSSADAGPLRFVLDDPLRLAAKPSTAPVLSRSTRFAPVPSLLPLWMKPDISTLHKPDILILLRHHPFWVLTFALPRRYARTQFEIFSDESDPILSVRLYGPLPLAEERQSRGAIAGGCLNI